VFSLYRAQKADTIKKLLVAKAKVPPDNKAVALLEEEISALRLSKRFNA